MMIALAAVGALCTSGPYRLQSETWTGFLGAFTKVGGKKASTVIPRLTSDPANKIFG